MFTLTQYFLDAPLYLGVISDVLFFGPLCWVAWRKKPGGEDE